MRRWSGGQRGWVGAILTLSMASGVGELSAQARSDRPAPGDSLFEEVMAPIERLFEAMRDRDEAAILGVFHPDARLLSAGTDPDGRPHLAGTSIPDFARGIAGLDIVPDERLYDAEVRVDGRLASVWVAYDFYAGERFSHCGFDSFQLFDTGEGWQIVSLVDTRQRQGCPER